MGSRPMNLTPLSVESAVNYLQKLTVPYVPKSIWDVDNILLSQYVKGWQSGLPEAITRNMAL